MTKQQWQVRQIPKDMPIGIKFPSFCLYVRSYFLLSFMEFMTKFLLNFLKWSLSQYHLSECIHICTIVTLEGCHSHSGEIQGSLGWAWGQILGHLWISTSIPVTRCPSVRQHFQTSSPLKPLGQLNSNFIQRLLRTREESYFKWSWSHNQDGRHAHIW